MNPPIIGIAGRAGHGKDTIGAIIAEHGYERKAFADKVRELALVIDPLITYGFGISRLSLFVEDYGWDKAKESPGVRRTLQNIGEGARQVLGEWVWVNALFHDMDRWGKYYVITDVRYTNEINAIHAYNGVVWYVDRPGFDNGVSNHISEQLDPKLCDAVITNDGTAEDLRTKVAELMEIWQ